MRKSTTTILIVILVSTLLIGTILACGGTPTPSSTDKSSSVPSTPTTEAPTVIAAPTATSQERAATPTATTQEPAATPTATTQEPAAIPTPTRTLAETPSTPPSIQLGASVGKRAPDFTLALSDGRTVNLAALRGEGKPVVLFFFATW